MPSTIVPILSTREYSLQPAKGLRYGNFEGIVHLPPVLQDSGRLTERDVSNLNNQQIYNKISQWYITWKPWQQRLALSGISSRCSSRQLDILATTLEPLRHRDYSAASNIPYPFQSSLTRSKTTITCGRLDRKKKIKSPKCLSARRADTTREERKSSRCDDKIINRNTKPGKSSESFRKPKPKNTSKSVSNLDSFADSLSESVIKSSLETIYPNRSVNFQIDSGNNESNDLYIDVKNEEEVEEKKKKVLNDCVVSPVCNIIFTSATPTSDDSQKDIPSPIRLQRSHDKNVSVLFEFMGKTLEYHPNLVTLKQKAEKVNLSHRQKPVSAQSIRSEHFSFSPVETLDFFEKEKIKKLGKLQREVKDNVDHQLLDEIPPPLAQFYKHVKFWPTSPAEGRYFVPAKCLDLVDNYKEQLCHIWNWMHEWEDYEKIALLKSILKISSPEILSSFLENIHQKLETEKGVNRLSDKMLVNIFSYLPPPDICMASQVCRKWRYLCTSEDLWMHKCLELGQLEGIKNIPSLVEESKNEVLLVDWKLAYQELGALLNVMKFTLLQEKDKSSENNVETVVLQDEVHTGKKILKKRKPSLMSEVKLRCGRLSQINNQERFGNKVKAFGVDKHDGAGSDSLMSDEDLDPLMSEYTMLPPIDETTNRTFDWFDTRRRGHHRVRTSLQNLEIETEVDNTNSDLTSESRSFKRERGEEDLHEPEDEEKALDIRPDLVQNVDLLGKTRASRNLEWKQKNALDETDFANPDVRKKKFYAGNVKSVLRVRKLQGHMNCILCLHYDKRRLVTAGLDRTVRIWDIRSGRSIHKLYGHTGGIRCLLFDDAILATGSWDCTVVVWSMLTFEKESILIGHTDCVTCVQFTESLIITGSYDKTVRVWSRQLYMIKHVIKHGAAVNSIIIADENTLLSSSADMIVRLSELTTGECLMTYDSVNSSILSLDVQGTLIVGSDSNGIVYFWNKESGESEAAIQAHDEAIHKVTYHKGRFLTASSDGSIKEWDIMTMTCVRVLQGHKGPVRDVKVTNDRIVSCSDDGTIRIWDLTLPKKLKNENSEKDSSRQSARQSAR